MVGSIVQICAPIKFAFALECVPYEGYVNVYKPYWNLHKFKVKNKINKKSTGHSCIARAREKRAKAKHIITK